MAERMNGNHEIQVRFLALAPFFPLRTTVSKTVIQEKIFFIKAFHKKLSKKGFSQKAFI